MTSGLLFQCSVLFYSPLTVNIITEVFKICFKKKKVNYIFL